MSTEKTTSKGPLTQFVMPVNYRQFIHETQQKIGIKDLSPALFRAFITKNVKQIHSSLSRLTKLKKP